MFALALDDVLYMHADEDSEPRYAAEKAAQFVYRGMKGREVAMPYWRLPDRLYDEPDEFTVWATAAFETARRAAAQKGKGKPGGKPRKTVAKAAHAKKPARRPGSTERGSKA
jgi:DNA transformation protein